MDLLALLTFHSVPKISRRVFASVQYLEFKVFLELEIAHYYYWINKSSSFHMVHVPKAGLEATAHE